MKRVLAAVALFLLLCGCRSTAAVYEQRFYYGQLSAPLQKNYGAVYEAVSQSRHTEQTVTVDGRAVPGVAVALPTAVNEEELRQLYTAVVRDNPEFYFLSDQYGYKGRQDGDTQRYTTLILAYTMDAGERQQAEERLEAAVRPLLDAARMTDAFERELALHDRLLTRCAYADETSAVACTAYGALVNGQAVCEGYARGLQYLLRRAGMEATVVVGTNAAGEAHMWNAVALDGEWYHVDPTANDSTPLPRHTYFNVSDQRLSLTHTVQAGPACAGEEQDYFRRRGLTVSSLRTDTLVQLLAAQLKTGDTAQVRFETAESFQNGLFFAKNADWFAETLNARTGEQAAYTVACDREHRTLFVVQKRKENS